MATQEDILRKVRALLDRANSTEFEGERDACLAKADALMMAHAIEQWQLEQANPGQAAQPVRVDMDFSWYYDERNREVASAFWLLFIDCAAHCRCVLAHSETSWSREQGYRIPVFGLNSDISYLGMMFTDLLIQLSKKLKPVYDPLLSDGENIYHAREAGMSYRHIARWMGREDLVSHKNGKVTVAGYLKREGDK